MGDSLMLAESVRDAIALAASYCEAALARAQREQSLCRLNVADEMRTVAIEESAYAFHLALRWRGELSGSVR